jgi:DNA mismatch endonuclease, patch repair protein
MVDILTKQQRSYCMSRIRGKDTKPEMVVRLAAHALGYRYRLHVRSLPGCPDLVFPARRKVIFVHGCFWHRHRCHEGQIVPLTRAAFWGTKLDGNRQRDKRTVRMLRAMGWQVLTLWECQVCRSDWLLHKLSGFLQGQANAHR